MNLSKEEFKVMAMLYAANIDGNIQSDELEVMLGKTDPDTYKKVNKLFGKMNDMQILECIEENKHLHLASEADKQQFMEDLRAIIEADEKVTVMENQICKALERLLA